MEVETFTPPPQPPQWEETTANSFATDDGRTCANLIADFHGNESNSLTNDRRSSHPSANGNDARDGSEIKIDLGSKVDAPTSPHIGVRSAKGQDAFPELDSQHLPAQPIQGGSAEIDQQSQIKQETRQDDPSVHTVECDKSKSLSSNHDKAAHSETEAEQITEVESKNDVEHDAQVEPDTVGQAGKGVAMNIPHTLLTNIPEESTNLIDSSSESQPPKTDTRCGFPADCFISNLHGAGEVLSPMTPPTPTPTGNSTENTENIQSHSPSPENAVFFAPIVEAAPQDMPGIAAKVEPGNHDQNGSKPAVHPPSEFTMQCTNLEITSSHLQSQETLISINSAPGRQEAIRKKFGETTRPISYHSSLNEGSTEQNTAHRETPKTNKGSDDTSPPKGAVASEIPSPGIAPFRRKKTSNKRAESEASPRATGEEPQQHTQPTPKYAQANLPKSHFIGDLVTVREDGALTPPAKYQRAADDHYEIASDSDFENCAASLASHEFAMQQYAFANPHAATMMPALFPLGAPHLESSATCPQEQIDEDL